MALSKINSDSVDLDGNVGIGTTSPSARLEVHGASSGIAAELQPNANDDVVLNIRNATANQVGYIQAHSDSISIDGDFTKFTTSGTERARIDSSGNLLVGQTTKRGKVTLSYNTNTVSDPTVYVANDGGSAALITFGDGGGSNTYGSITKGGGNTVSYTTSSDHRLKENVVELTGATDRLKQLEPKRFNFIADEDDTTVDGFLAHEVSGIVPEAITGTHNEVDEDGNPVYQGIDQSKLVPLLVATIKELEARIVALEGA